jgi:hypothetical protein
MWACSFGNFVDPSSRSVEQSLYHVSAGIRRLALGDDNAIVKNKQYATIQSISGTGALRLCAHFLEKFYKFPGGGMYSMLV